VTGIRRTCRPAVFAMLLLLAISGAVMPAASSPALQATGTLTGTVVEGSSDSPVPFAWIELQSGTSHNSSGQRYSAGADERGRFSISGIAPQGYLVAATSPGYAPTFFAAANRSATKEPGERLTIAASPAATTIEIHMVLGGVITGRVTDHFGQAQPGAEISLRRLPLTTTPIGSPFSFTPKGTWRTDASGRYRLYGLAEGEYLVSAGVYGQTLHVGSTNRPASRVDKRFYPGASDISLARPVNVRAGAEAADIDIQLRLVELYSISGRVHTAPGERPSIALWSVPAGEYTSVSYLDGGGFRKEDVAAGRYRLTAYVRGSNAAGQVSTPLRWATTEVVVTDQDVTDIEVPLQAAMTAAGRFQSDEALAGPARVSFTTVGRPIVDAAPRPGMIGSGGEFLVSDLLPGAYTIAVFVGNNTRLTTVVTLNGHALPNNEIEVTAGSNITGLDIRVRK
jgi:hypothetical protein